MCLGLLQKSQTAAGTVMGNKHTRCSVRDLPWADPPLPDTKHDQKGVRVFSWFVSSVEDPGVVV